MRHWSKNGAGLQAKGSRPARHLTFPVLLPRFDIVSLKRTFAFLCVLFALGVCKVHALVDGGSEALSRWRLSAIVEDGEDLYAGLVDKETGRDFLLRPGQTTPDGAEFVTAYVYSERAVFRKGGQWYELELSGGAFAVPPVTEWQLRETLPEVVTRDAAPLLSSTTPDEERIVFIIEAPVPPERVFYEGETYLKVGEEVVREGPAMAVAAGGVTAIGSRRQIAAVKQVSGVSVSEVGPVAGYAQLVAEQTAATASNGLQVGTGYHDAEQVSQLLEQFAATYPQKAERLALGTTHMGATIWALRISTALDSEARRPAVLFDGGIHGNEYPSTEVCLDIANELLSKTDTDSKYPQWLKDLDVYVVPLVNPDGRYLSYNVDLTWRKNARDNDGDGLPHESAKPGNDGVDINRNFPLGWGSDDEGSSGEIQAFNYRGAEPASEPETQAMMTFIQAIRPLMHLSFHTYFGAVIGPFNDVNMDTEVLEQLHGVGEYLAESAVREDSSPYEYLPGRDFIYTSNGTLTDWAYGTQAAMSYTVELGTRGMGHQPEYSVTRDALVPGIRPAWQRVLEAAGKWVSGAQTSVDESTAAEETTADLPL